MPIESELGLVLPTEFKEYTAYFPPGVHGNALAPVHPAVREGGLTVPGRIRLWSDLYRGWDNLTQPPMPFYPDAGGLIPWADNEGDAALCWLPEGDDPDLWPVFAARAENTYERIPGSTIEALIAVLRGEAGQNVFTTWFQHLHRLGDPFEFAHEGWSAGDVELPEPEYLDTLPVDGPGGHHDGLRND